MLARLAVRVARLAAVAVLLAVRVARLTAVVASVDATGVSLTYLRDMRPSAVRLCNVARDKVAYVQQAAVVGGETMKAVDPYDVERAAVGANKTRASSERRDNRKQAGADTHSSAAQKRAVPTPLLRHDPPDSANTTDRASAAVPLNPVANEYLRMYPYTCAREILNNAPP